MKLFIFRHGETEANRIGTLFGSGSEDLSLNETGVKQAEGLRDELSKEKLEVIYSSPLRRAYETAKITAASNGSEIVIVDNLREVFLGEYEGQNKDVFFKEHLSLFGNSQDVGSDEFWNEKLSDAEGRKEALNRWLAALNEIKSGCNCSKAGVATHGGLMGVIYAWYFKEFRVGFKNVDYFVIEV